MSKLSKDLGLNGQRQGPLPPKFSPKLHVRVSDGRSKQVVEFDVEIPIDGYSGEAWDKCQSCLHVIFEKLGLLKSRPQVEAPAAEDKAGPT